MKTTKQEILKAMSLDVNVKDIVAKNLWFLNFEKLVKMGFSVDFATSKATDITMKMING